MGIWTALTFQGKLAVAATVILGLIMIGYVCGDDGNSEPSLADTPGFVTPTRSAQAAATTGSGSPVSAVSPTTAPNVTVSPSASTTPEAGATSTGTAPEPTPTPDDEPEPTATTAVAVPTSTPPPPEPTLPPTPEPPTATPEPSCIVNVSLSPSSPPGSDTATGTLTCGGAPVSGAGMSVVFLYQALSNGCSGTSDGSGSASCSARVPGDMESGPLVSAEACFSGSDGTHCGRAFP